MDDDLSEQAGQAELFALHSVQGLLCAAFGLQSPDHRTHLRMRIMQRISQRQRRRVLSVRLAVLVAAGVLALVWLSSSAKTVAWISHASEPVLVRLEGGQSQLNEAGSGIPDGASILLTESQVLHLRLHDGRTLSAVGAHFTIQPERIFLHKGRLDLQGGGDAGIGERIALSSKQWVLTSEDAQHIQVQVHDDWDWLCSDTNTKLFTCDGQMHYVQAGKVSLLRDGDLYQQMQQDGYASPAVISAVSSEDLIHDQVADRLRDGSGLLDKPVHALSRHDTNRAHMWSSRRLLARPTGFVEMDLGRSQSVASLAIWNYHDRRFLGRSARHVRVQTALLPGGPWHDCGWLALRPGCGLAEHVELGGLQAQYLRLQLLDNWGDDTDIGLAEVAINNDRRHVPSFARSLSTGRAPVHAGWKGCGELDGRFASDSCTKAKEIDVLGNSGVLRCRFVEPSEHAYAHCDWSLAGVMSMQPSHVLIELQLHSYDAGGRFNVELREEDGDIWLLRSESWDRLALQEWTRLQIALRGKKLHRRVGNGRFDVDRLRHAQALRLVFCWQDAELGVRHIQFVTAPPAVQAVLDRSVQYRSQRAGGQ